MKFLVCGGCGFIGSAFIRNRINENPHDEIINVDNLSIGSNQENVSMINKKNYDFVKADIMNLDLIEKISKDVDIIINFAAETHVDRSISNPKPFINTNVIGTYSLLESARKNEKIFFHVSTDEVYGDLEFDQKPFTEKDNLKPSNPYSATKASADLLVQSYMRTYNTKCIITRCTNNFGPFQFPEKLLPKTIIRAKKDLKIPLYGDGNQIRNWIFVLDHINAIDVLIKQGELGEIYNITSGNEISNKEIVEKILKSIEKPLSLIEFVNDRPGHDKRYSIDSNKIKDEIGWKPKYDFSRALDETINWYLENQRWWDPLITEQILHPQPWTIN